MSDVVQEAAQAVLPFVGAGASAAAQGLAKQAGASLSDGTLRILERIRGRLVGHPANKLDEPDVAEALRQALSAGEVTEHELRLLVSEVNRVEISHTVNVTQTAGKNIIVGDITTEVFNG